MRYENLDTALHLSFNVLYDQLGVLHFTGSRSLPSGVWKEESVVSIIHTWNL